MRRLENENYLRWLMVTRVAVTATLLVSAIAIEVIFAPGVSLLPLYALCAGTFVLIAGGIDLSIGAIYGLSGAVALTTASSVSPVAGVLAGLAVGYWQGLDDIEIWIHHSNKPEMRTSRCLCIGEALSSVRGRTSSNCGSASIRRPGRRRARGSPGAASPPPRRRGRA